MTSAQFAQPTRGDEVQLGPFLADLPSIVCQRQVVLDKASTVYAGLRPRQLPATVGAAQGNGCLSREPASPAIPGDTSFGDGQATRGSTESPDRCLTMPNARRRRPPPAEKHISTVPTTCFVSVRWVMARSVSPHFLLLGRMRSTHHRPQTRFRLACHPWLADRTGPASRPLSVPLRYWQPPA